MVSKINRLHITIITLWLLLTVVSFSYFIEKRLVAFDPNHQLANLNSNSQAWLTTLGLALSPQERITHTVIHFSIADCQCNQYNRQHVNEINQLAKSQQFNIVNLRLNSNTPLNNSKLVPATPAVAIVDNDGELLYLGPYGQGLACTETSGLVKTVMNNFIQGFNQSVIVSDAKGCYCHTSV